MKKKLLALLLCINILITAANPVTIFASDGTSTGPPVPEPTVATEAASADAVPSAETEPTTAVISEDADTGDAPTLDETKPTEAPDSDETEPTEAPDSDETEPTEAPDSGETEPTETPDSGETEPTETPDSDETEPTEAPDSEEFDEEEPEESESEDEPELEFYSGYEEGSYLDFLAREAANAWGDPTLYVGFEAQFNHEIWTYYRCSEDPTVPVPAEEEIYVYPDELVDEDGNSLRVLVTEIWLDEANELLWFKVQAPEGGTLPDILIKNPYILQTTYYGDLPSLRMLPHLGTFTDEIIYIQKQAVAASPYLELPTADLPDFFPVTWMDTTYGQFFDLGDTTSWPGITDAQYRYVLQSAVTMIPAEVSHAYEELLGAGDLDEFQYLLETLPQEIRDQFTDKHLAGLEAREERLTQLENVQHSTIVDYNGVPLEVTVQGKIPETGVTLNVTPVSDETIAAEGFNLSGSTGIITALDIKLLQDEDGSEWQPDEGDTILVSIDMASLGYEDGTIMQLHHKHGDTIDKFDIFIVMDGKVTVCTNGFSIFAVTGTNQRPANNAADLGNITLTVGQTAYYYCNRNPGTWDITDTAGAIYYTVYSTGTPNSDRVTVPWIQIIALKETGDEPVNVRFHYGNANQYEDHPLTITAPKAAAGGKALYLKDEVNTTGQIVATVVDSNGNILPDALVGAAFSWKRSDGLFIVPAAYSENYDAVNIARDHGGLVNARSEPVRYDLTATLADGTVLTDSYTVYYQSEIINASFETPVASRTNLTFFPNGWPGLHWKTTAPGSTSTNPSSNVSKDIEIGSYRNGLTNSTSFGPSAAAHGNQIAEINAEAFGSLYQDIISVPFEVIEWDFSHAARIYQDWATTITNGMFVVMGATEDAQKLAQRDLKTLVATAKANGASPTNPVVVTYGNANYTVWYHNAGTSVRGQTYNGTWTDLNGSYQVPLGQYRTRLFFVSDSEGAQHENAGNLIDNTSGGQYKHYLIEYYIETFDNETTTKKVEHVEGKDEEGRALIYASQEIKNLTDFTYAEGTKYYLQEILINGQNYPYDIRYSDTPSLYIEKYPEAEDWDPDGKYEKYDIVMQIYIRDTVVALLKNLEFPSTLTEEQKLALMDNLVTKEGGYNVHFELRGSNGYTANNDLTITQRDPKGNYFGYLSLGDNPSSNNVTYVVEEMIDAETTTQLPGLTPGIVTIQTTTYSMGKGTALDTLTYKVQEMQPGQAIVCDEFTLTNDARIAELIITNTYVETEAVFKYVAVGNGKVTIKGQDEYQDTPSETLAYYSGKAVGGTPKAASTATFVGWYLDEDCTIEVTDEYGVELDDGTFQPNPNILADEITFYAKFDTGTITINRTNAEPNQSFVYRVTGTTSQGINITLEVTLECNANGTGTRSVYEVPEGSYTVTEVSSWTWRYPIPNGQTSISQTDNLTGRETITFKFSGNYTQKYWLNAYSAVRKNTKE